MKIAFDSTIDMFNFFAAFFVFFARLNNWLAENDYIFIVAIAVSIIGSVLNASNLKRMPKRYIYWMVGFLFLYGISLLWSIDRKITLQNFIATVGRYIIVFYIVHLLDSLNGIKKVSKIYIYAEILNCLVILVLVGPKTMVQTRGTGVNAVAGNSNMLGIGCAYALLLLFYFLKSSYRKKTFIGIAAFLLIFVVVSGSKAALLVVVMGFSLTYILNHRNRTASILLVLLVVSFAYYLMLNVGLLYQLMGKRIEALANGLKSVSLGYTDNRSLLSLDFTDSDRLRLYMLIKGVEWFTKKPLLGYGMACFKVLFASVNSRALYGHNNMIEVGVGLGIIGLITYYSIYFYILKKSIKFIRESTQARFCIMLVLTFIISEFCIVTYLKIEAQIMMGIATCLASCVDGKQYYEEKTDSREER